MDAAIATNAALGVVMPSGCGIGGDAFWLIWDAATGRQAALNGSGRAGCARRCRLRCGHAGLDRAPAARPADDHGPRRGPVVGRRPCAARPAVARRDPRPGHRAGTGRVPGLGRLHRRGRGDGTERRPTTLGPDAGFFAVYRPLGRSWRPGETGAPARTRRDARDAGPRRLRRLLRGRPRRAPGARAWPTVGALDHGSRPSRPTPRTWGEPIAIDYRGVRVTTHPPNSSGVVALELLSILAQFEAPPAARPSGRPA